MVKWRRLARLVAALLALWPVQGVRPAVTMRNLIEAADISGLALSPDGAQLAFRTEAASIDRNDYRLSWWVIRIADGQVREIADGGGPIYDDTGLLRRGKAIWAPDGASLYFLALGPDGVQVRRAWVGGGQVDEVTHDP